MKGQLAVILCVLALGSAKSVHGNRDPSQAAAICAADASDSILVAHEDCHKFYKCTHGKPVAIPCPDNLVYNPESEYCDWADNYECKSQNVQGDKVKDEVVRVINDDPSKAPEICAAEGSDGVLVSHENCNSFYKCDAGVPVAFNCYGDLVYNPIEEYCDWADNYECKSPNIKGDKAKDEAEKVINDDPSKAPEICAAEESDGVLVSHENCHRFYKCSDGIPVALDCVNNLVYNPIKEYCDWPANYPCKSIPVGNEIIMPESILPPAIEDKEEDDVKEQVIYDDPSKAPEVCAKEGSDSTLVAHEDCNKFYKCYKGLPVAIDCPLNLVYNPPKEYCDWPFNVDCGNRNV